MSFQDVYGGGNGGMFGMPVPQNAIPQGPQPSPLGSFAGGGMSALRYLLPAMFAGSQSSTAAPGSNNAAPANPQAPGSTAGVGNPGAPAAPPVPMPQPRPQMAGPMSLAPPNPGAAQPNPSLQQGPGVGGAPNSNPSMVQSFINAMRSAQPLQAPAQQPQAAGGGQSQGILPKAGNDISQLMKLFGGGAGGGSLAAGAGASSASPLMLSALF